MAISPSQRWPVFALVGSSVMWGGMWWPLKQINALGIGGIPLVICAFGAASLLLLPILALQRRSWTGDGRFLLLIALLGGYANIAYTEALIYGEVVRVMVLFYLVPVWGVLGGRLFLGERIDWIRGLGVVLALSGAFIILGGFKVLAGRIAWTDLLAVTCGMAFAGNNLVFRARQASPVSSKVAAMVLGSAVLALPLAFLAPWPQVAPASWGWVAAYGIGWMLVATAATQWAVTHMEAGRASTLIILELVTAVVSATLIGGERMGPGEWFGSTLVIAAALLEAWRAEPQPATSTV
ncbi:DMT family transporter [Acidihalobacter prosperus]